MGEHTKELQIIEAGNMAAGDRWHVYLADKSGRKVAALWGGQEEKAANANLFMTANELLEALENLLFLTPSSKSAKRNNLFAPTLFITPSLFV